MSNFVCSIDSCPVILSSICVIYQGESLIYTGINDGDSLQTALQKIDGAFADAGLGYAFQNGVIQTTPGVPVELGGSLLHDTTISGNYKLTLAGRIQASALITTGGTSSQFVKGDGSLDSTAYQVAGNYITALTGDATASGPGSAVLTLATVNANPGTYGSATLIPRVTVDAKGRVTAITTTAVPIPSSILVFEGDVSGSGTTGAPVTLTLATVNPNVYNSLTFVKLKVNEKGLVTGAAPVTNLDIEGALGYVPVTNQRTITINGITQNLSANRSWTLAAGVSTVTASAPIASTGGANPNISIAQADGSTNGYLSSTDWILFNSKQAALNGTGLVRMSGTGVSYDNTTYTPTSRTLTINGTSYDLSADRSWTINSMVYPGAGIAVSTGTGWSTSIVDNSTNWNTAYSERISSASAPLSIASNAISISQASGSSNGYLSSGDWTTFNNKEGSITAGTTSQYWRGDKTWQTLDTTAVPEGSNLYYTDARVRAALSVSAPLTYSSTTGEFGITKADASTNGYLSSTDWNTFNNKQPADHYITDLSGEATAAGPGIATVTLSTPAVTGKALTGVNIVGGGTIVATDTILQAFGKLQNQINSLIGGSIYQGTWNASTNTPTLTSGVGTDGYYYITNVAGNTNLDGISDWHVGDWAIFHDGAWQQVDNTDAVISVNGETGAVSLVSSDIPEGATNLYYTNARARQAISLTTTGSSGAATYNNTTGVLNVPNYNPDLTGYVPTTRTLTINGTALDLSADRSWSVGTVTSVAQLTLGTTGTDLSSSIATGTTTPVITLNVPTASATNRGALSSTDWSTFNSKQAALSGTGFVKISGTTISYDNSTYALDSVVVKLTGSQSIDGLKTFIGYPQFNNGIFIKQDGTISGMPGYNTIDADANGIIFGLSSLTGIAHIELTNLTTSRYIYLPDASGTFALTSNLSAYLPLTGGTLTGALNGTTLALSSTLSINGGVLAGNNIVSMRCNPTGGQFRIEKSDGSLSAYPFYVGADGTALAYYYNTAGALKVLLHTDGTSYFGNNLSVGYATYAATTYALDVNGTGRFTGALNGTSATFSSLTTGYVTRATTSGLLTNSLLYDTGSVLLVGATTASTGQSKLELVDGGPVGLKIISTAGNGNNTFLSIQANKEWRFVTNRGDLIGGNQGDLIIRNNTDGINHIILNQGGSTTFASSVTANGTLTLNGGNEQRFYRTDNAIYTRLYDAGSTFTLDNRNGNGFSFQSAGSNQFIINSDGAMGFNYPILGSRSFMFRGVAGRPLVIEAAEAGGVQSLYLRPNASGRHLISSNYLSGGVYLPLALSGRENDSDFVLSTNGNVGFGTSTPLSKLNVNGGKTIISSDDGAYGQFQINSSSAGVEATILLSNGGSGVNLGNYTNAGVIGMGAYSNAKSTLVIGTGYSGGTAFIRDSKLGLRVSSPDAPLHVGGAILVSNDPQTFRRAITCHGQAGTYSQIKVFFNKTDWGSVTYDIKLASAGGTYHTAGCYYSNPGFSSNLVSINAGNGPTMTLVSSSQTGNPQGATWTFSGATMIHPILTIDLACGAGYQVNPNDIVVQFL